MLLWIHAWIKSWIRRLFLSIAPSRQRKEIQARKRASDLFDIPGSTLSLRKDAATAEWDDQTGMARVLNPRGKIWNTTGVIRSSSLLCNVEETVFLVENGYLILTLQGTGTAMDLHQAYELLSAEKNGSSVDAYNVYLYLKTLGYVVARHNVNWTEKREKKNPEPASSDDSSALKLDFDVYSPNSQFRKTSPGLPLFSLCISRTCPSKKQVDALERETTAPVKFATVQGGHVGIFSFSKVELPSLA